MYLDLIFALGHRSLSLLHIPIFTILDLSRQPEEKWTIARVARGCKVLCFREFYGDFETQEDEMESLMVRSQSDFSWLGIDVKEILDQRENIVIATVWHQDVLGALTSESDELSGSLSISHVELLRAHGGTKFQVHRLGAFGSGPEVDNTQNFVRLFRGLRSLVITGGEHTSPLEARYVLGALKATANTLKHFDFCSPISGPPWQVSHLQLKVVLRLP